MAAKKKSKILQIIDNFIDSLSEEEKAEILEKFNEQKNDYYEPITLNEWAQTHPFGLPSGSDKFYVDFANDYLDAISVIKFEESEEETIRRELAMTYAAYFEDFVSDLKVWPTLRDVYKEKYGATLPFFDCTHGDYYEDDINIEDLKLLTWQVFSRVGQNNEKAYSPYGLGMSKLSEIAYDLMIKRIDDAPIDIRTANKIKTILKENDYFDVRELSYWLSVQNKLTAAYWEKEYIDKRIDYSIKKKKNYFTDYQIGYMYKALFSWQDYISMLGCHSCELLARLAENHGYEKVAKMVADVEKMSFDTYGIVDVDKKTITVKNQAGKEFKLLLNSMAKDIKSQIKGKKSIAMSIVRYGDYWMTNGVAAFYEEPIEKIKNIPGHTKVTSDAIRKIIDKHNGQRIFYCRTPEEATKIATDKPLKKENSGLDLDANNYLVMLSEEKGFTIIPNACQIFKDKKNPFFGSEYNKEDLEEESLYFICNSKMPDDVAKYIQNNKLLPYAYIYASQGKRVGKKVVQENMRFLFGFYRVANENVSSENQ